MRGFLVSGRPPGYGYRLALGLRLGLCGPRPNQPCLGQRFSDAGATDGCVLPKEAGRAGSEALER
jgi:hypothetical protein